MTETADPATFSAMLVAEDYAKPGGWYTLIAMSGLTLFAYVNRQIFTLIGAAMAAELQLSDGQLGMIIGLAFALFTVLASLPIAWLADKFNRRFVLAICVAVWSLGTIACGFAENFMQLFIATVAVAAGESGLGPIVMGIVPDLFFGHKRVLANGLYYVCTAFGGYLALILGGFAVTALNGLHGSLPASLQAFSSWRLAIFAVALPAPLFLGLIAFMRLEHPVSDEVDANGDATVKFLPFLREHWRAMALVSGAIITGIQAFGALAVWLPTINTRLFGTSAADNGLGMGLAGAIGMVCGVAASNLLVRRHIASRRSGVATLRVSWLVCIPAAPALLLFPFVGAAWHGFALYTAVMISGSVVGSLCFTILQAMAPGPIRTRFLATFTIVGGLAGGIAPSVVGWISTMLGGQGRDLLFALTLVSAPCWLLSIVMFRLAEKPYAHLTNDVERLSTPGR